MRISRFQFQGLTDIIFRLCQTVLFGTDDGTVAQFLISLGKHRGYTYYIYKERKNKLFHNAIKDFVTYR